MKKKKLTFNQFKQFCLNHLINKCKNEGGYNIKQIRKDFKTITLYDEIREIYSYYDADEFDILEAVVKLK